MSTNAAKTISGLNQPAVRPVGRVLVVDDEPAIGQLLAQVLTKAGLDVVVAASAAEAETAADKTPPDLVIADVHLADGSGLDLVQRLRERVADLSAVFITGRADADLLTRASRLRPVEMLTKPLDLQRLTRAVAEELHRRRNLARQKRLRGLARASVRQRRSDLRKLSAACSDLTTACRGLQQQMERQEALIRYQNELLACANEDDVFRRLFRLFATYSGPVFGAAMLCDDEARLQLVGRFGVPLPDGVAFCRALAESVTDAILIRPRVRVFDSLEHEELVEPRFRRYLPGMTMMAVPLMVDAGRLIGLVVLYRKGEQPFTDDDVALAEMIVPATAAAAQRV